MFRIGSLPSDERPTLVHSVRRTENALFLVDVHALFDLCTVSPDPMSDTGVHVEYGIG
jgi:hypothetical protein